jgi:hypothetical protein
MLPAGRQKIDILYPSHLRARCIRQKRLKLSNLMSDYIPTLHKCKGIHGSVAKTQLVLKSCSPKISGGSSLQEALHA